MKLEGQVMKKWLHYSKEKIEFINLKILLKHEYVKINIDASNDIKIATIVLFYKY